MFRTAAAVATGLLAFTGVTSEVASARAAQTFDLRYICVVHNYSAHALQQMAARHISKSDIARTVKEQCSRATRQTSDAYLFPGSPEVIMSPLGNVVTAYWATETFTAKEVNTLPSLNHD